MTTTLPTWLSRALNLVGIVVVAATVYGQSPTGPVWLWCLVAASLLGWCAVAALRDRSPFVLLALTAILGGIATAPSDGVAIVPVVVAILVAVGSITRPAWHGIAVVLLGALFVPVGLPLGSIHPLALAAIEGGIAVAAIGGFSRRQARRASERERELLEQRARGAALAERQAVARDIHDVLAHSLGGLVIQLDAIDAQLEAGRVADAASRVRQARALAASGLAEARRAVDALRDERVGSVASAEVSRSLVELVDAHRALGGSVEVSVTGEPRDLPGEQADAVRRALQESLTNARKHAPGQPVVVALDWATGVDLVVSNPILESVASPGGHGLRGMAERFGHFGTATASAVDGRFVVHARVDA
jgi:signal transduction histidine kinase